MRASILRSCSRLGRLLLAASRRSSATTPAVPLLLLGCCSSHVRIAASRAHDIARKTAAKGEHMNLLTSWLLVVVVVVVVTGLVVVACFPP